VFFFQAEDGIRDRNVTGVQTCALPISRQLEQNSIENFQSSIQIQTIVSNQLANQLASDSKNANDRLNQIVNDYNNDSISEIIVRSEERRVGKECKYCLWRNN